VPNPNVIKAKAEKEILRDELAKVYITSNWSSNEYWIVLYCKMDESQTQIYFA
jgi:hypothetical protein